MRPLTHLNPLPANHFPAIEKIIICIFIIIFLFLGACVKGKIIPPDNRIRAIKVTDYTTNLPVEGANVSIDSYLCAPFSSCGVLPRSIDTKQTDSKGFCIFKENVFDMSGGVTITKKFYWTLVNNDTVRNGYSIEPIGYLNIRFIKTSDFEKGSYMLCCVHSGRDSAIYYDLFKGLPKDTSKTVQAFGGQTNNIYLTIRTQYNDVIAISGPYTADVPKSGKAELEIRY